MCSSYSIYDFYNVYILSQVMKKLSTWGGAEQFCSSFGGHLVSVASASEEGTILGYVNKFVPCNICITWYKPE